MVLAIRPVVVLLCAVVVLLCSVVMMMIDLIWEYNTHRGEQHIR